MKADLSKEDEIQSVIAQSAEWMRGLDATSLNARIQLSGRFEYFRSSDLDTVFAINVQANFIFAREVCLPRAAD